MSRKAMAAVRVLILFNILLLSLLIKSSLGVPEAEALLKLKKSFPNSDALASWLPDSSPCQKHWTGVVCEGDKVSGLLLRKMGLSGNIDIDALLQLPGLRTLSFDHNSFSGPIPEFNKLGALKAIYLSHNQFSGEIPGDYFSNMLSLKRVNLAHNQFTGKVPESLSKPSHLMDLELHNNQFSGAIPVFQQSTLIALNLSNNKLEGQIPESFSKFNASSFTGNDRLCGKPLDKACESAVSLPLKTMLVAVVIVGTLVIIALVIKTSANRKQNNFRVLRKESMDDVVEVQVSNAPRNGSTKQMQDSGKKSDSRKGSTHGKNVGTSELLMINDEKGKFGLPDLMKAAAEVLGNGGLGSAYKAAMANGLSVVVKRIREMNSLGKESFDVEMRRLGRLRHRNILTPLAYHYRREEKLLVSEYVPKGSLLYVLHGDRGSSHAEMSWPIRLRIIKGIAQGLQFLFGEFATYDLPHGNLKSSNILLGDNYEPLLSDYAFYPLLNPSHAAQAMFAFKSPEFAQYQQISPKTDIYCFGIVVLEILTGKFPSHYLSAAKGGTDVVAWVQSAVRENREAELIDPEISGSEDSLNQMVKLLQVGNACTASDPSLRPDMREVVRRIEDIRV